MARRASPITTLSVFVGAAAYFLPFVPYGFYLEDEGTMLYQITRTHQGEVPYIDFHTGYTPGLFYGNAFLFDLMGVDVIALRIALAVVNALAAGALFALACRVAPTAWALAGTLVYVAFLPFFGGEFASFNIPYPSWYVTLLWLASTVLLLRYLDSGRLLTLLCCGIATGGCFCFKPNAGVFSATAAGLGVMLVAAGSAGSMLSRVAALGLGLFGLGLAIVFGFSLVSFETTVFVMPWLALAIAVWRFGGPVRRPGGHAVLVQLGVLGFGFAVTTFPWLVYVKLQMPTREFLREVLLIGGDVQQVYRIPYPLPEWWALVLSIGTVAVALVPRALGAGWVRGRTVMAGAGLVAVGVGVAFAIFARMPEGLGLSVVWQLENASFTLVPLAMGAGVWWVVRACRAGGTAAGAPIVLVLVSALAMLEQMNPRLDFMHLVMGVPASVAIVAWLGGHVASSWRRSRLGRPVAAVLLAVPLAVAGTRLATNLGRPVGMDRVDGAALLAPVGGETVGAVGVERAVGQDLIELSRVVAFVRAHTRPDEPLFGFPALAAVNFLSGRRNPVRHDYFFPGRPAHAEEASVVATLAAERPPYVVSLNDRFGFFQEAPAYYLLLRDFLARRYTLELRAGRYDVLRRRDHPAPKHAEEPEPAWAVARMPELERIAASGGIDDVPALLTALRRVHRSQRAEVTRAVLAVAARHGGLRALVEGVRPGEADELMLVRSLGEFGGEGALDYLTQRFAARPSRRMRSETGRALAFVTARLLAAPYVRDGTRPGGGAAPAVSVAPARLEAWLRDRKLKRRVGAYAAIVLGRMGRAEAVPLLRRQLAEKKQGWLQTAAARALVDLRAPDAPCDLVGLLGSPHQVVQNHVPSMLLELAEVTPARTRACLAAGLRAREERARAGAAWVSGVLRDPGLVPSLATAASLDEEGTRLAALWALGEIGDARGRGAVSTALASGDPTVRAFAGEAAAKLERVAALPRGG